MKTIAAILILAASTARADDSYDYTVKKGDTCAAIAIRELGDRAAVDKIHALNPGMGPSPHDLVPGRVLKLPRPVAAGADAKLSTSHGAVRVRKPTVEDWDAAKVGMDLFRTWRVNSRERSSAEVTFHDTSRLFMRENTIVIIFGPTASRTEASPTAEAELESGALETRLEAMRHVVVRTPSTQADLGAGHSLVTVDAGGTSIVGNHGGTPVKVRGVDAKHRPIGKGVAVAQGMGSKIAPAKLPDPPRPLPPAPAWGPVPSAFVELAGGGATISTSWQAVSVAATYRVELLDGNGGELLAVQVPATATRFEAHGLPPGAYVAHVSTIDTEGFESIRSTDHAMTVAAAQLFAPGSKTAIAAPAANPDLTIAQAPLVVAAGTRVSAPCTQQGGGEILTGSGPAAIVCGDAGPAAIVIAPVHATTSTATLARGSSRVVIGVDSAGALGSELTVRGTDLEVVSTTRTQAGVEVEVRTTDRTHGRLAVLAGDTELASVDVAIAALPPPPPPPVDTRRPFELGVFAGLERRHATTDAQQAALAGMRLGVWPTTHVGAELEAAASAADDAVGVGHAAVLGWRAHLALGYETDGLGVRLLAGVGADHRFTSPREDAGLLSGGVAFTLRTSAATLLRIDLRDDVTPTGDHTEIRGATFGFSTLF